MKSKEKKKTTFMQIMSSPVLLLRNARDSYINSFNGCANDVGRGGVVVCPVPHVSHVPKNFSYGSSKSRDDEKLREMLRQATCKRIIGREVGLNLQRQTEVIEATTMRKSYSVGVGKIGRIDEDKPCSFEENLSYPRSKSHAIGNVLHR
ncbi:hypothetical protein AB3S75_040625 [Citrus x aurantiifolia]